MDFSFDETQLAVDEAVRGLLDRKPSAGQIWPMLQEAGLHVLSVPEKYGGVGLGAVEVGIVAGALGEAGVVSPYLGNGITGLVASRADAAVDVSGLCRDIGRGGIAAVSARAPGRMGVPEVVAVDSGGFTTVTGDFGTVLGPGNDACWLLGPTTRGPILVDASQQEIVVTPIACSLGTEEPESPTDSQIRVVDARGSLLLGDCTSAPAQFSDIFRAVLLSYGCGLLKGALRLTAEHLKSRNQFGRPLATFQAASQEIADIYVLSTALEATSLFCNWTLDRSGTAGVELDAALYMFASEGRAAMQMCHHLHGGLGVDITYPMHRYFSLAKDVVRHCGGERQNLKRLGEQCSSV